MMDWWIIFWVVAIVLFVMVVTGNLRIKNKKSEDALFSSSYEIGLMKLNKWNLIQTPSGYGRFWEVRRNNSGSYDIYLDTEEGGKWVRGVDPLKDLIPITGEMIFAFLSGQAVYPIAITMDDGGGSVKVSMSQFLGIPDVNESLANENERLRQRYTNSLYFSTNPHDGVSVWKTLQNESKQLSNISKNINQGKGECEEVRVQRSMPFEGFISPEDEENG